MNYHSWVFLLVLLTIAGELAYLIYKMRGSAAELRRLIENFAKRGTAGTSVPTTAPISSAQGMPQPQALTKQSIENLLEQQTAASMQMVGMVKALTNSLDALHDLSSSGSNSGTDALDQVVEKFNAVTNKFTDALKVFFGQLSQSQQEMLEGLSKHLTGTQAELYKNLASFSASLPKTSGATTPEPTREEGLLRKTGGDEGDQTARLDNEAIQQAGTRLEPRLVSEVKTDNEGFHKLHMWILSNIQQIMNRSLDQWTKPEELVQDLPSSLRYTAQIIDPDSKLLLLGVQDHPEYLALVLPGGYIGSRFYDWFSIPKGTNERIERTIFPAIVQQDKDTFRVSRRGSLAQD